jgi:outer membrane protein OmpA-like peptidoglycan-associated protein
MSPGALKYLPLAVALALAAGCAISPLAEDQLAQARAAYAAAQQNAQVARHAPSELDLAGRTLNQAERLAREGADSDQVRHIAYVAEQRAYTARELALARAAEAQIADATQARNRVLLEARAQEAEQARQRAEQARTQAEQAKTQAELAKLDAEQGRMQAERAQREREQALRARQDREAQLNAEMKRFESELRDLRAQATDRGWVLSLGSEMLFDPGQASLKPGGRQSVERIAQALQRHPERRIMVEGFTDSTGSEELNQRLSEQRAEAVRQALVQAGVPVYRITTRGYGEAMPIASNDTAAGRQLNRRVQIVLSPEGTPSVGSGTPSTGSGTPSTGSGTPSAGATR